MRVCGWLPRVTGDVVRIEFAHLPPPTAIPRQIHPHTHAHTRSIAPLVANMSKQYTGKDFANQVRVRPIFYLPLCSVSVVDRIN